MNPTAKQMVERLELETLEKEGGWFRRIYTGEPDASGRPTATSIYALFTVEQFSALHRLDADEQFLFLAGDPFETFEIDAKGVGRRSLLGSPTHGEASSHRAFSKDTWFGGRTLSGGLFGWSLITAVVTPGFLWEGFELGSREELVSLYPKFESDIIKLTRAH